MTRQEVQRLRMAVPIAELVEESGVELVREGAGWRGRCPLHPSSTEATLTLVLDPARNTWRCETCGVGGRAVDWLARQHKVSIRRASAMLRARLGDAEHPRATAPDAEALGAMRGAYRSTLAAGLANAWLRGKTEAARIALLTEVAAAYHAALLAWPAVLAKMSWRGDVRRELIEHFTLGQSCRGLLDALATEAERDVVQAALQSVGVLKPNGEELFAGALVVPIRDSDGGVVDLVGGNDPSRERRLPAPRGIFHRAGFAAGEELLVLPTVLDALRLWYAGQVAVTAWPPEEALTAEHLALIERSAVRRVVLVYPDSPGGDEAALRAAQTLKTVGVDAYQVRMHRRFKPTSKQWDRALRAASPLLGAPERPEPPSLLPTWTRTSAHRGD